ncbi:hypothetical protein HMPREF0454_00338 [Hafnia alvei ATCC 51873]|uniref:Uncharacterized protein n=1 Tax=Hafnia alvei ATCC 51873 TaxID=1002364 RepID=G9Y1C1_HAFAL|nr:hypothetical protein HMPREF0454_00338 [Hafnia alvei ATCC 51873]
MEDHGNFIAANAAQKGFVCVQQRLAVKQNIAAGVVCWRRREQAQNRKRSDAFPRTRFSDQCEGFTGVDIKRYPVNHRTGHFAMAKMNMQIANAKQRRVRE